MSRPLARRTNQRARSNSVHFLTDFIDQSKGRNDAKVLDRAGVDVDATLAADADSLRGALPDVQRAVTAMLAQVKEGRLGTAPAGEELTGARISWL